MPIIVEVIVGGIKRQYRTEILRLGAGMYIPEVSGGPGDSGGIDLDPIPYEPPEPPLETKRILFTWDGALSNDIEPLHTVYAPDLDLDGVITKVALFMPGGGDVEVDVWKRSRASLPITSAHSITGTAPPTLVTPDQYEEFTELGDWTDTDLGPDDVLAARVESITTGVKFLQLAVFVTLNP